MRSSRVKENYEFNTEIWVVSVLNTGSKLGGHAMIVVEGIQRNSHSLYDQLFIGQYDIRATLDEFQDSSLNSKGKITEIKCHEGFEYKREYKMYTSKCHYVTPLKAKEMIASIKEDQAVCERASHGKGDYPSFQYLGTNHLLSETNMGDNCASWCLKKLAIAGIGDGSGKSKPEKVAGGCLIL
jgi:hypothetical protein